MSSSVSTTHDGQDSGPPAPDETEGQLTSSRRWIALIVVLLAAFMELLDVTVVNIGIPSIQRNLQSSYASIEWILAGYSLSYALILITAGRLGDIAGRKLLFMLGVAGFTVASLICGVAQSPQLLISARVLEGLMAGIMAPQVLALIQVIFPPAERGAAFAMYGAIAGLATVAGPIIGGVLIQANLFSWDWRPIFLVNLPVGLVTLIVAGLVLRESKAPDTAGLDLGGGILVTGGLILLIYPLVQGRELGWPLWTYLSMAASLPVLALFGLYEWRKTKAGGSPLITLALFRRREFLSGLIVALVFFAGMTGFFLVYALYLQIGLGFGVLHAGLTGIPWSVGTAVGSGVSATMLAPRFGRKVIAAGSLLMAAGIAGLILSMRHWGVDITSWEMIPSLLAGGLGMGLVIAPLFDIVLAGVPVANAGSASGVLSTAGQVGSAIGVALLGVVFFSQLGAQSAPSVKIVEPRLRSGLTAAGVPTSAQDSMIVGFRACFHDRSVEQDPTVTPPSCHAVQAVPAAGSAQGQRIGQVMAGAATAARKHDFDRAFQRTLGWEIGLLSLTVVLSFLLPAKPRDVGEQIVESSESKLESLRTAA